MSVLFWVWKVIHQLLMCSVSRDSAGALKHKKTGVSWFYCWRKPLCVCLCPIPGHVGSGWKGVSKCPLYRSVISFANVTSSTHGGLLAVSSEHTLRSSTCRRADTNQCLLPPRQGLSEGISRSAFKWNEAKSFDWRQASHTTGQNASLHWSAKIPKLCLVRPSADFHHA